MNKPLPTSITEWIEIAKYQQVVADLLAMAKSKGATQAEVGVNIGTGLNVSIRKQSVDTIEFNRDKSVGITVYCGHKKGAASTADITPSSLEATVNAAINIAKFTQEDPYSGLADASKMASKQLDLQLYHPWGIAVEEAIAIAIDCEQAALSYDPRIANTDGATLSSSQGFCVYANSHGFMGSFPSSRHSLSCMVIAKDDHGMEREHDYSVARSHHDLASPSSIGKHAAELACNRLNAKKVKTGQYSVLLDNRVASGLIGHFLSAISGSRLFRKTSFLHESLHTQVFPTWLRIDERPHLKGALGSASFDSDGLQTVAKDFVTAGTVSNYILSTYSARRLNMQSTANAGGVHNCFVSDTNDTHQSLLQKMGTGLWITRLMGQGINLVTGDYSRGASGFWVENGEIQYPVSEITIAGNLKEMFKGIVAIGNNSDPRQTIQVGSILLDQMTVAGS